MWKTSLDKATDHGFVERCPSAMPNRHRTEVFLNELALRSNVSDACRAAGVSKQAAYDRRIRSESFAECNYSAFCDPSGGMAGQAVQGGGGGLLFYVLFLGLAALAAGAGVFVGAALERIDPLRLRRWLRRSAAACATVNVLVIIFLGRRHLKMSTSQRPKDWNL